MIFSITKDRSQQILCHYLNATSQVQVARIANIQGWYFERVIFPGQHCLFDAPQDAQLEIHASQATAAPSLLEKIPCEALQVESGEATTQRQKIAVEYC